MTDEAETRQDPDEKEPASKTEFSGSERAFVRLTFWQTVLSLVGVFIAIVALYAALTESEATRNQTAAAVWPFVQLTVTDHLSADAAEFRISLTNAGVGPARMRSMRVLFEGRPLHDWHHALELIGEEGTHRLGQSYVSRRVLIPGETIDMVSTMDRVLVGKFLESLARPGNSIAYCYCSIFDACWVIDSEKDLQTPDPVDACPDFGDEAFGN
jgi:archaellum component FlaF (FlaF/FlaG flagellin family)